MNYKLFASRAYNFCEKIDISLESMAKCIRQNKLKILGKGVFTIYANTEGILYFLNTSYCRTVLRFLCNI